ncbi:MAG: hypothetical protein JNK72_24855 [Myxococcales bacterium]|nr:hypothetical protein [Myxococcales bacterium]
MRLIPLSLAVFGASLLAGAALALSSRSASAAGSPPSAGGDASGVGGDAGRTFGIAPSSTLTLANAPVDPLTASGRELMLAAGRLSGEARERLLLAAILGGNHPPLEWIPLSLPVPSQPGRTVTVGVLADYLRVGRTSPVRVPLWPSTAQRAADHFRAMLPPKAMVDTIWRAAMIKVAPRSMQPRDGASRESGVLTVEHDDHVNAAIGGRVGLIAGQKKDIIVGGAIVRNPGKVIIYGWHRTSGEPIQPASAVHSARYVDYSHGTRLLHGEAVVDGRAVALADVLADPALAPAITGSEGTLSLAAMRYSV